MVGGLHAVAASQCHHFDLYSWMDKDGDFDFNVQIALTMMLGLPGRTGKIPQVSGDCAKE
ncbi:hypothetical protein [Janthinobacterium sp. HH104]|uniref:hypothetical protein n=1 Tax=Janthinobacterium sp. HH104 TaxID=1537276 RepID=UPI0015864E32|nr:hypothetical protein [Janthinobacterium sp. HH104]